MQLLVRRSEFVASLVILPFSVLTLLLLARSRLFDNWAITTPVAVVASAYLLGLIALTLLNRNAAEQARKRALARMDADLLWLGGAGRSELVEPFKRLITNVKEFHTGAFAPLLEQPLLKALMLPLGGLGGAQLLDAFLLAR